MLTPPRRRHQFAIGLHHQELHPLFKAWKLGICFKRWQRGVWFYRWFNGSAARGGIATNAFVHSQVRQWWISDSEFTKRGTNDDYQCYSDSVMLSWPANISTVIVSKLLLVCISPIHTVESIHHNTTTFDYLMKAREGITYQTVLHNNRDISVAGINLFFKQLFPHISGLRTKTDNTHLFCLGTKSTYSYVHVVEVAVSIFPLSRLKYFTTKWDICLLFWSSR